MVQNGVEPTIGTVTEEKKDELEEFMDQAELILGALGYKVFELERVVHSTDISLQNQSEKEQQKVNDIPPLPEKGEKKIGAYVREAMRNLSQSGFVFTDEEIDEMCTSEWSVKIFHTEKPFMKRYIEGKTTNKDETTNQVRFWAEIFSFDTEVYVSKEWYASHFERFDAWYLSLQ